MEDKCEEVKVIRGAGDVTDIGERGSGEQLAVRQSRHLLTWDRALHAHAHIRDAKSGLILHHFWARCVSPNDT